MLDRDIVSEGLTEAGGSSSQNEFSHLVLIVGRRPQYLPTWTPLGLLECLHDTLAGFSHSKKSKMGQGSHMSFLATSLSCDLQDLLLTSCEI